MRSEEELKWVENNSDYIRKVIQKNNAENEIVFLCCKDLQVSGEFPFRYYRMPGIWNGDTNYNLRAHFDHADDFLQFCGRTILLSI